MRRERSVDVMLDGKHQHMREEKILDSYVCVREEVLPALTSKKFHWGCAYRNESSATANWQVQMQ